MSDEAVADPRELYDRARSACPVAHGDDGVWTLYSHADVHAAALDATTFSSATSRHVHIPNSLDGAEHRRFRDLIDSYLTPARVADLEPMLASTAQQVLDETLVPAGMLDQARIPATESRQVSVDAVQLGERYAVRTACRWLGWPDDLENELLDWMDANRQASRSGGRAATGAVASWFDHIIGRQIRLRRDTSQGLTDDVTSELMADDSLGRPLTDAEITSILRNWTGGDLSSLALCIGVVAAGLADHPEVEDELRRGVPTSRFDAVLDEMLRIDDPFVANFRVTTAAVTMSGVELEPGARVRLNWTAANRDPNTFGDPDVFDPHGNAQDNLVYGIGEHVCPGRTLATTELRLFFTSLLAHTRQITPGTGASRVRAEPPVGGYASVPLLVD